MPLSVKIEPIAEAPVKTGEAREGFWLWPDRREDWTAGRWNGEDWVDSEGYIIHPLVFALLPAIGALKVFLMALS